MKTRCPKCKATDFRPALYTYAREVDGRTFKAEVAARRCAKCDEMLIAGPALLAADRALTSVLASGSVGPEGFRWLRRAAGLASLELAALLDVTPGTVSRWENGKKPLERRAVALVAALALEAAGQHASTRDLLGRLASGRKPARRVRLGRARRGSEMAKPYQKRGRGTRV
jgi:DNA-binding transcriptional regulator YiaG